MAAAYAPHAAQNQPFLDGNKCTGLVAALVSLDLNGVTVPDPQEGLYDAMIAVAERRMKTKARRPHALRARSSPCGSATRETAPRCGLGRSR